MVIHDLSWGGGTNYVTKFKGKNDRTGVPADRLQPKHLASAMMSCRGKSYWNKQEVYPEVRDGT